MLRKLQQIAIAPIVAAVFAFPFWMAFVLDQQNAVELGVYLVVSLCIGIAALLWLDRLVVPRVQLGIGIALELIAFAVCAFRAELARGAIEKLMWAAWLYGTLSAHFLVCEGLRLRRLLTRAQRYFIGIPVAFAAVVVILALQPPPPFAVAIGFVGTFAFVLIPGRVW